MDQTPDYRRLRRTVSGKKRRTVRSLRQQAERHREIMLCGPKHTIIRPVRTR